jgi:hypothetical protein
VYYSRRQPAKSIAAASVTYLRFVIERIADYRISQLDDLLPWNVAHQIAKTELAVAA